MDIDSAPAPTISNCSHVAVIVNDMDEAYDFYTQVLGLKDLNTPQYVRDKGVCWLDLGGNLALHLVYGDNTIPDFWAHIALSVTNLKAWNTGCCDSSLFQMSNRAAREKADATPTTRHSLH